MEVSFEGRKVIVPDDANDDEIASILEQVAAEAPAAPVEKPVVPPAVSGALDTAGRIGAIGLRGARSGVADLLGFPVDAVNAGMRQIGLGSDKPFMGSDFLDDVIGAPAAATAAVIGGDAEGPEPQNGFERIVGRVGREIGASAVPVGTVLAAGRSMGTQGAKALAENGPTLAHRLFGHGAHSAAANPVGLVSKELQFATAAGAGAGAANEAVGNPQQGDNFWSDFLGSLFGAGTLGGARFAAEKGRDLLSPIVGGKAYMDKVAGEHVAGRLIDNSTAAQQFAGPGEFDTADLVSALRRPSEAEQVIPGYQANIGDRSGDAGLQTFAFNIDGQQPGRAAARRASNELAVNERVDELAPDGDPALFRDALDRARSSQLQALDQTTAAAQREFDALYQRLAPVMGDSSARGSQARAALAEAYQRVQDATTAAYARVRDRDALVPMDDLASRFQTITDSLPLNDQQRLLPAEARVPQALIDRNAAPDGAAEVTGPRSEAEDLWSAITSGEPAAPTAAAPVGPVTTDLPLDEVMSVRSGLTDDIRAARATPGRAQAARIAEMFRVATDDFLDSNMSPAARENYNAAKEARRDQADRFERPGTALREILQTREGGDYRTDASAVARRLLQRNTGKLSDFQAAMREAGSDPRLRTALEDELRAEIQRRDLGNKPAQLLAFMDEYREVFRVFPEFRQRLTSTAAAKNTTDAVVATADQARQTLTNPARSPVARYLQYGDAATQDAMTAIVKGKDPAAATRQLLDTAGGTPEALANARAAFWTVVSKNKFQAPGVTGTERWNAGKVKKLFDDPKVDAAAKELWRDSPKELDDIKELFDVLSRAEGSTRARAPGSSGTGQIVKEKFDPSLSAQSLSARYRAVSQGRASPSVTLVGIAGDWMRRLRVAGRTDAIERVTAEVVNNPGLAADLLETFNPANFEAGRRMITQKYGVRVANVLGLTDEGDPAAEAAGRKEDAGR
jgi:hypothetical protein